MRQSDTTEKPDGVPSARRTLRPANIAVMLLIAAALAAGSYYVMGIGAGGPARAQGPAARVPQFVRQGERVTVPDGSPLRGKLAIEPVADKSIKRSLLLPAVVEADPGRLLKVLPPVSGRITQLKVQLGERVGLDQPLVVLDSSDLGTAYADYDRAKVVLALAQKTRDRQRDLQKIGGAALKDLQQAETDYASAQVEFARAEARLRQIGVNAEATDKSSRLVTVTAPIAGSVIDLQAAPGAYWNDPTSALMTVADLSTIWVTANVPESDTRLVSKGQAVEVTFPAYPGEVFKGQVLFVSDVLDPDTRRTKVRIAFPNPDIRLKPNMFATVNFLTPAQMVPVIPTAAVVMKDDRDRVYMEVAPWTFEPREVDVGYQQDDHSIVKSGVKAGDRIVVRGGVLLND